jgi:hypothetical protein
MNVFGRNLNNISKLPPPAMGSPGGRDHFGNHNVMVMIGKNIKSSVIGGVTADSKGTFVAAGIDSATGAAMPTGRRHRHDQDAGLGGAHAGRGARHPRQRRDQRLHRRGRRQGRHGRAGEPAGQPDATPPHANQRLAYSVRHVATRPFRRTQ